MVDSGETSFKLHNAMGYEAVTLGNHDYLMGVKGLDRLLNNMQNQIRFTLLAANIDFNVEINDYITDPGMMLASRSKIDLLNVYHHLKTPSITRKKFPSLNRMIKPSFIKKIGDINICFIGVTSDEKYYKWKFLQENINIDDPVKAAIKETAALKKRGIRCHYTIALTHMLLEKDLLLAKKSKNIDLIIGGHSLNTRLMTHDVVSLNDPEINNNEKNPPILKAGPHASLLGKVLIDIDPKTNKKKIVSQEFIPVKDVDEDQEIKTLVDEAWGKLRAEYGRTVDLDEHLGYFSVGADDDADYIWSSFVAEAIRDITHSDTGINDTHVINNFGSRTKGYFPLSRFDVWSTYPRFFEFENRNGWNIYKITVHGIILKKIINKYLQERPSITFSRLDFNTTKRREKIKVKDISINGKRVRNFDKYTMAVPEGIFEGMKNHIKYTYDSLIPNMNISPLLDKIASKTEFTVFEAMESLLEKHPEVNSCKFHAKSIHMAKENNSPCDESNRVYLMDDDSDAFSIRANLINYEILKEKEGRIDIHYYSIGSDKVTFTELALLRKAARAGVKIRIVIDGLATYPNGDTVDKENSRYIKGILKELTTNGVEIKIHHDPFSKPVKINSRNHNKILKLSQATIIGDRNLRNEHFDTVFSNEKKYIGFDIVVKGDILHKMDTYLEQFWNGPRLQEIKFSNLHDSHEHQGKKILDSIEEDDPLNLFNLEAEDIREGYEELSGKFVKPDYLEWIFDRDNSSKNIKVPSLSGLDKIISAIYKANKTIKIVSPYIVLTNRMKNALAYAMEKNVEVEFITNGFENSMLFLNDLMHAGYIYDRREYCHLGLKMREILEESGRAIHAKVVMIDEKTVFISSNNWNHRSQKYNVEIGIRVDDQEISKKVLNWYQNIPTGPISKNPCPLTMEVVFYKLFKFFL